MRARVRAGGRGMRACVREACVCVHACVRAWMRVRLVCACTCARARAVSHEVQYFDFIYCKELHENKDAIGQRVLDFFYSVNKRIPHESYVRHIGCHTFTGVSHTVREPLTARR